MSVLSGDEHQSESIVLIADDEPDFLRLMAESVQKLGFQVVTASGGHEAYWFLEKRRAELGSPRVSLVISDWKMPQGDGVWLLSAIRSGPCKELPFMLISGAVGKEELMEVVQKGADAVLLKPFTFEVLKSEVNDAISRRQVKEAHRLLRG